MANRTHRLAKWLSKPGRRPDITIEDVTPAHPEDYPARHLKEILDERRADWERRASHPTGLPEGPNFLT